MPEPFDQTIIDFLISPTGKEAVELGQRLDPTRPADVAKLRTICTLEQARAVLELVDLRRRAKAKFSRAESMLFDRVGFEQSTSEQIALYKAKRFERIEPQAPILDLGCGIGGDAIGLTAVAEVQAIERSAARLRMAEHNLEVYGRRDRCRFIGRDVREVPLTGPAFHLDPDRRSAGRRTVRLEEYEPGIELTSAILRAVPTGAIKLSPALNYHDLPWPGEIEMISEAGECKQLVLWTGELAETTLRATVLPQNVSLTDRQEPRYEVSPIGRYLYDPDGGVVRLRLLPQLAGLLDLDFLAPGQVVLTSDSRVSSPLAECFEVEETIPFHQPKLRKLLRTRGVGTVTVKPRGAKVDVDRLARALSAKQGEPRCVFLLRLEKQVLAVVTRRLSLDQAQD